MAASRMRGGGRAKVAALVGLLALMTIADARIAHERIESISGVERVEIRWRNATLADAGARLPIGSVHARGSYVDNYLGGTDYRIG